MTSRLAAGQSLARGQSLLSPNQQAHLEVQGDGNVVLYHRAKGNQPLWATATKGSGQRFIMQGDGNLVLLDGRGKPVWALNLKTRKPGSTLVLQDDGNLVIYSGTRAVWSTETQGFQDKRQNGDFLANAAKTCGRPFGAAIAFVDATTGKIDKAITKIPFIGPALHAVCSIATEEYQVAGAILKGERIDHVVMDAIHREISDYKAVAPYVETVITLIPGVGPEISSGIAVGLDLASGQPITDALIDGAAAMVPGGELAKMAFEMGKTAIQAAEKHEQVGQALLETGVAALGAVAEIPAQARAAIVAGVSMIKDVATGVPVKAAALKEGIKLAGAELKSATSGGGSSVSGEGDMSMAEALRIINAMYKDQRDSLLATIPYLSTDKDVGETLAGTDYTIEQIHAGFVFYSKSWPSNARFGAEQVPDYRVADALINKGLKTTHLTPAQQASVKNALKVSIAMAHGKASQTKMSSQLASSSTITTIKNVGIQVSRADPTVGTTGKLTSPASGQHGYLLGMGLVQHKCGIFDIGTLRSTLSGDDVKGFDLALSLHTGRSTSKPAHYKQLDQRAQTGFLVTKGMMLAPADNKAALMKTVAAAPQARDGAVVAIKQVAHLRDSWLARLLHKLGW